MIRARLLVAVVACAGAASAADAQIINGSFETGDFTGWVTQDLGSPFFPLGVYAGGTANSFGWPWSNTPTDGDFDVFTGFDGDGPAGPGPIYVAQDAFISGGTLSFDYRAAWDLSNFGATMDRFFQVTIQNAGGGAALQTNVILTAAAGTVVNDTGALSASVDVSAFLGQTVRVSFEWHIPETFTGPAQATLDNVRLTPAPGVLGLLGIACMVSRRRR